MPNVKRHAAVFIDRDGTMITERGYLSDPAKIKFYPSVFTGLRRLQKEKFKLVVVTNQSGVFRKYLTVETLAQIHKVLSRKLRLKKIHLSGIYFCPHGPDEGCRCRKPKTWLVQKAARDLNLDLTRSFVIGDQHRDVMLGHNWGAKSILVLTGGGRSNLKKMRHLADHVSSNLETASRWIVNEGNK